MPRKTQKQESIERSLRQKAAMSKLKIAIVLMTLQIGAGVV